MLMSYFNIIIWQLPGTEFAAWKTPVIIVCNKIYSFCSLLRKEQTREGMYAWCYQCGVFKTLYPALKRNNVQSNYSFHTFNCKYCTNSHGIRNCIKTKGCLLLHGQLYLYNAAKLFGDGIKCRMYSADAGNLNDYHYIVCFLWNLYMSSGISATKCTVNVVNFWHWGVKRRMPSVMIL